MKRLAAVKRRDALRAFIYSDIGVTSRVTPSNGW